MAIYIELYTIYFLFLRFRMLSYCIVKLTVFFVILLSIIFFSPSSSTHLCLSLLFDFYSLFFSVFEHCLCFFFCTKCCSMVRFILWFLLCNIFVFYSYFIFTFIQLFIQFCICFLSLIFFQKFFYSDFRIIKIALGKFSAWQLSQSFFWLLVFVKIFSYLFC